MPARTAWLRTGVAGLLLGVGCTVSGDAPTALSQRSDQRQTLDEGLGDTVIVPGPSAPPAPTDFPWNGSATAFTFSSDDGSREDNLAWQAVFQERGLHFTLFVISGQIGMPTRLTVADIKQLYRNGFEIGSHSRTHRNLTTLDTQTLMDELVLSAKDLEAMIDGTYRCRTFAYPQHAHDTRVMLAAERSGYLAARDGGTHPAGRPNFSQGFSNWKTLSLFEVPVTVTATWLTNNNQFTESQTRQRARELVANTAFKNIWLNVYAHTLSDIDVNHMRWILDEMQGAGVWVDTFENITAFHCNALGRPIPPGVERPKSPRPLTPRSAP